MGKGGNGFWLLPLFFLVKSEPGGTTVSIEKKSLVSKQVTPAPSNKKKSNPKAKVETAKPASSKVVAALKMWP
jgi:hypothetical protein